MAETVAAVCGQRRIPISVALSKPSLSLPPMVSVPVVVSPLVLAMGGGPVIDSAYTLMPRRSTGKPKQIAWHWSHQMA